MAHAKACTVTELIKNLDGVHRKLDPLIVTRGKHHEHLGMTLDFEAISQACRMTQYNFIKKMCKNLLHHRIYLR